MVLIRPRSVSLLLLVLAGPLAAQLPPLTVPRGLARFDIGGQFSWWDEAWVGGNREPLIGAFLRSPVDAGFLPGLTASEAALRAVTGGPGMSLSPGSTSGNLAVNVGTAELGAALGVTSRITIFGLVPIVRVRIQQQLLIDSAGATAGFNPADPRFGTPAGASTTTAFLGELSSALSSLAAAIQSGQYDGDPARLAEAQAALARGTSLRTGLESLLREAAFLPITGSPGAAALNRAIDSIRTRLTDLDPGGTGSPPLTTSPALPGTGLPPSGLEQFATHPQGPIAVNPFEPEILRSIGDVELGAAFALLDGRPPTRGFTVRSVVRGTVRLPTGKLPDPGGLFERGTGSGHLAVRGDLVTDLMGSRFGARLIGAMTVAQPAELELRVTAPEQPFAPASSQALIERRPGLRLEAGFLPYVRIARNFSLVAGVAHSRSREDRYAWAPGQAPIEGLDPAVLGADSRSRSTMISAGLSFSHGGVRADGRTGRPVDASLSGQMVVGSAEGRVPATRGVVFQMRVYGRIF